MPSPLTADQLTTLANAWTDFGTQLSKYRVQRKNDSNFDDQSMDDWIQDVAQFATNFSTRAMTATFDDAAGSFNKLNGVLTQANVYIKQLQAEAQSWDRFASVANAMVQLAAVIGGGTATAIIGAVTNVTKTCSGN